METSLIGKALDFGSKEYRFESCVSNLGYNYAVTNVINIWKISKAHGKLNFDIRYTKKHMAVIKLLSRINVIFDFKLLYINNILYVRITPLFKHIKPIGLCAKTWETSAKKFPVTLRGLKIISKKTGSGNYIISTSRGLLTHHEAIQQRLAGRIVGIITA